MAEAASQAPKPGDDGGLGLDLGVSADSTAQLTSKQVGWGDGARRVLGEIGVPSMGLRVEDAEASAKASAEAFATVPAARPPRAPPVAAVR